MQTFLPYLNFYDSLLCLDNKRLGKQRVEAKQILNIVDLHINSRWKNHPAVKMWQGYSEALKLYHNLAIHIWKERRFNNTMKYKIINTKIIKPDWLTEEFCISHKSNLLRKDPVFYGKYNWNVPDNLPYVWPV